MIAEDINERVKWKLSVVGQKKKYLEGYTSSSEPSSPFGNVYICGGVCWSGELVHGVMEESHFVFYILPNDLNMLQWMCLMYPCQRLKRYGKLKIARRPKVPREGALGPWFASRTLLRMAGTWPGADLILRSAVPWNKKKGASDILAHSSLKLLGEQPEILAGSIKSKKKKI